MAVRPAATRVLDRRGQLLDRLSDAIAETGIEGVSIRDLAARANVSIGTVQYHFATKTDLLVCAWHHAQTNLRVRQGGIAELGPREQLIGRIEALLPPSPEDRLSRLALAMSTRATHDRRIAELHSEHRRESEVIFARLLARTNRGRLAESRDAAAELLALLDGLSMAVLTGPTRVSPDRARRIARDWIRAWLAG
ncbi:TetR/AcrR family transcriptional regulator [Nocardia panacis]|nr:TetR/AcrR family transcriptional regulator [Nocardia panacis]